MKRTTTGQTQRHRVSQQVIDEALWGRCRRRSRCSRFGCFGRLDRDGWFNGSSRLTAQGPLDLDLITLNSSSQFVANSAGHIASFVQNNGTSTFAGAGLAFDAIDIRGGTVNYNAALALPSSLLRVAGHTANLNADLRARAEAPKRRQIAIKPA